MLAEPETVEEEIKNEFTHDKGLNLLLFKDSVVDFVIAKRLVAGSQECQPCRRPMTLVRDKKNTDGKKWRCSGCRCVCSIRRDSFFDKSRLSVR